MLSGHGAYRSSLPLVSMPCSTTSSWRHRARSACNCEFAEIALILSSSLSPLEKGLASDPGRARSSLFGPAAGKEPALESTCRTVCRSGRRRCRPWFGAEGLPRGKQSRRCATAGFSRHRRLATRLKWAVFARPPSEGKLLAQRGLREKTGTLGSEWKDLPARRMLISCCVTRDACVARSRADRGCGLPRGLGRLAPGGRVVNGPTLRLG
jgi:hypothetical protein